MSTPASTSPAEEKAPPPSFANVQEAHAAGAAALEAKPPRFEEAHHAFAAAVQLDPDHLPSLVGLARLRFNPNQPQHAFLILERARRLDPEGLFPGIPMASGELHHRLGDHQTAEHELREAIRLDPDDPEPRRLLAVVLQKCGRLAEAIALLREALARKPDDWTIHSSLLFNSNYLEPDDPAAEFDEHVAWNRHVENFAPPAPAYLRHENDDRSRDPDRPLRIGYLSPDFRWHSVAHVCIAPLRAHDRSQVEIWCYAEYRRADLNTLNFRDIADHWVETKDLSDEELAERIRDDHIDILVELAAFTAHNRLFATARRPAPIQAGWLGYSNTWGLKAVDYRLSDDFSEPDTPAYNDLSVETIERLPESYHCFQPPPEDPPVRPAPCRRDGVVTFGSFNNYCKQTPAVYALWARVMNEVPGSRLLLKSGDYADPALRRFVIDQLGGHGIDHGRVHMIGATPSTFRHLDLYGEMDIYLDPFPYNGTITTLEALWMGLPSVAFLGTLHRARISASFLKLIGREEWIAASPDDYVRIAVDLASDFDRLDALRPQVRKAMAASPLCDADSLARDLETTYRRWWRRWLEQTTCGS